MSTPASTAAAMTAVTPAAGPTPVASLASVLPKVPVRSSFSSYDEHYSAYKQHCSLLDGYNKKLIDSMQKLEPEMQTASASLASSKADFEKAKNELNKAIIEAKKKDGTPIDPELIKRNHMVIKKVSEAKTRYESVRNDFDHIKRDLELINVEMLKALDEAIKAAEEEFRILPKLPEDVIQTATASKTLILSSPTGSLPTGQTTTAAATEALKRCSPI